MGRILVTGATGMLGGHLMGHLAQHGWSVVGTGRQPDALRQLEDLGYPVFAADLAEPLPDLGTFDAVVHAAARSAPFGRRAAFERANVAATRQVVAAATRAGVRRFVHISTPSIYFAFRDQPLVSEDMPLPPPVNAYAATKAAAEEIVREAAHLSPVLLRPRGIYGPGDTALLPRLLRAAARGPLPLLRGGRGAIDLTYVEDVVRAVAAALDAPESATGQAYNISGGEVLPIHEIAEAACGHAGQALRWRRMPLWPLLQVARAIEIGARALPHAPEPPVTAYGLGLFAYHQSLDITRARTVLNWQPQVPFAEGLVRTFGART